MERAMVRSEAAQLFSGCDRWNWREREEDAGETPAARGFPKTLGEVEGVSAFLSLTTEIKGIAKGDVDDFDELAAEIFAGFA